MKSIIRRRALELGFDDCRFTSAQPPEGGIHFQRWLQSGRQGEMSYLARNAGKRLDPQAVLPGARSVICLAASYAGFESSPPASSKLPPNATGVIARYARHEDYHHVIGRQLDALARFIAIEAGAQVRSLGYVDTGPILERDLAQRSGLGFIGKHTNLISRRLGNWIVLAEILTTLELDPDPAERNRCGACVRCIQACPTDAITGPFELDARRCISYLTIELKGPIPESLRPAIGTRIFGCDDCLAACPWNRFAREGSLMKPHRRRDLEGPALIGLLALDETEFRTRFAGTPMLRAKRRGLLRNVCVALGNSGGREALEPLHRAASDPEPLVAEHARWAIDRIESRVKPA